MEGVSAVTTKVTCSPPSRKGERGDVTEPDSEPGASEQPMPHANRHSFSEHLVSDVDTQLPVESVRPGGEPGDCWLQPTEVAGQRNAAAGAGVPGPAPVPGPAHGAHHCAGGTRGQEGAGGPAPAPGPSCVPRGLAVPLSVPASQVALAVMNLPASTGDTRAVGCPLGRSPGGGHGTPLQCSCLESPRERGA